LDGSIRYITTLYLPDSTATFVADGGTLVEVDRDDHGMNLVPVVPIVNRPQLRAPLGAPASWPT
jgi:hypothetical protein